MIGRRGCFVSSRLVSNIGFALFHITNHCLGCVGYVCVGRSYQNRGETLLWGRGMFVLVISKINIGYQKSLTPPLNLIPKIITFMIWLSVTESKT